MLFGSLSENKGGLSLDNFTVSSSEIIIHRVNRLPSDISGNSIVRYSSIRLAKYLMEMQSHGFGSYDVNFVTSKYANSCIDIARRKFEALDGEIHFENTKNYRKNRIK